MSHSSLYGKTCPFGSQIDRKRLCVRGFLICSGSLHRLLQLPTLDFDLSITLWSKNCLQCRIFPSVASVTPVPVDTLAKTPWRPSRIHAQSWIRVLWRSLIICKWLSLSISLLEEKHLTGHSEVIQVIGCFYFTLGSATLHMVQKPNRGLVGLSRRVSRPVAQCRVAKVVNSVRLIPILRFNSWTFWHHLRDAIVLVVILLNKV